MKSIRKKLRNSPLTLYQIQDIGGCRAIVETISEQQTLIRMYESGLSRHGIIKIWPYVSHPRGTGYRSHHIVMKFSGQGEDEVFNRQRIEVQIRTRLQHIWATAVEAAGLVRGEDLKGGEGHPGWLRLFALMSSEIAAMEETANIPGVPDNAQERRAELQELDAQLSAAANLTTWNNAVKATEGYRTSASAFYMVQYDPDTQRITVEPSNRVSYSSERLIQEEANHDRRETVLIELERIEDLRAAYPNYFLDVGSFTSLLNGAIRNRSPAELRELIATKERAPLPPQSRAILNFKRWQRGTL